MSKEIDLINIALKVLDKETIEKLAAAAKDIEKGVKSTYGFIHKRTTAEVNGKTGFLIWDYILYNEISFQDEEGNIISFFHSASDEKTEAEWNNLVEKYGI